MRINKTMSYYLLLFTILLSVASVMTLNPNLMVSLSSLLFFKKPRENEKFELFAEEESLQFDSSDEFFIPDTDGAEYFALTKAEENQEEDEVVVSWVDRKKVDNKQKVYAKYFRIQNGTMESLTDKTLMTSDQCSGFFRGAMPSVNFGKDILIYWNAGEGLCLPVDLTFSDVSGQFIARNGSMINKIGQEFSIYNNTIVNNTIDGSQKAYMAGSSADDFIVTWMGSRSFLSNTGQIIGGISQSVQARIFKEGIGGPDITFTNDRGAFTEYVFQLRNQNGYLVTWSQDDNGDPSDEANKNKKFDDVRTQWVNTSGELMWSQPQNVSSSSLRDQNQLVMEEMEGGSIFATWKTNGRKGDEIRQGSDVVGRIFNMTEMGLQPWGPEFQINNINIFNSQQSPVITRLTTGEIVVVWQNNQILIEQDRISGRCYNGTTGEPLNDEFPISQNTDSQFDNYAPSVVSLKKGGFFTAWGQKGASLGLLGRTFDRCPMPAVLPPPPIPSPPIWPYFLIAGGGAVFIALLACKKRIYNHVMGACGGDPAVAGTFKVHPSNVEIDTKQEIKSYVSMLSVGPTS